MEKKSLIQYPISKADLLDERWIKTPFAFSSFGSDFSLLQQNVMLQISQTLQAEFNAYYKTGDIQALKERLKEEIRIPFEILGITPNHYPVYFSYGDNNEPPMFISQMLSLAVQCPDAKEDKLNVAPMFLRFSVPTRAGDYKIKFTSDGVEKISERTENYLSVLINPFAIQTAFDMSKGYIRHLRRITEVAKKKSTPRIYLLLLRYRGLAKSLKFKIPYTEVKEYLGASKKNYNDGTTTELYSKYSEFKKRVMEPAQADLLRLSLLNQTEFVFDFLPVYPRGRKTGDPLLIEFILRTTPLGDAVSADKQRKNKEKSLIEYICSRAKGIKKIPLRKLVQSVTDERFEAFSSYCYKSLFVAIEKAHPENMAAYTLTVLEQFLKQKSDAQPRQLSLAFSSNNPMNPIKQWALCQKKMCDFVGDEVARRTFAELTFESYDEKTRKLLLQTTKSAFDEIEGHYTERFKACLTKCFGSLPLVSYRLKPAQQ